MRTRTRVARGTHWSPDHGIHYFRPGIDQDDPSRPDPRWCNVCGEEVLDVLPGHPIREGAGYDCECGACIAQRESRLAAYDIPVPTALDYPGCRACQMWEDAGASWPRPCAEHYGGEADE